MTDTEIETSRAAPARAPGGPRALQGQAAGGGRVIGPARVIRAPEEAARIRPGEIAVVEVARATWITWLVGAVGLVAETGGLLSNGAIVARELGLAVVVDAAGASALIEDGQPLEVDGATGLVRLLPPAD